MSNTRPSPFEALTGVEKQIKWLEYQSVRLPYVQGSMEPSSEEQEEERPPQPQSKKAEAVGTAPQPSHQAAVSTAKPSPIQRGSVSNRPVAESAASYQRTRHQQYDAVIARMKQAEKLARQYQTLP